MWGWLISLPPLGSMAGIEIPRSWRDFFTSYTLRGLVGPKHLQFKASNMIISEVENETTFCFRIPSKCSSQVSLSVRMLPKMLLSILSHQHLTGREQ
jgi:hypothetical protein